MDALPAVRLEDQLDFERLQLDMFACSAAVVVCWIVLPGGDEQAAANRDAAKPWILVWPLVVA